MIQTLLIFLLSSACILNASASRFGLSTTEGKPLELLELTTKALVEGPYAEVQYIQTYKNPLNHIVETEFHFPRTDSSIFHKFEAVFQNQTIIGRIFEKETAKKMFHCHTKRGNTVAYSERNQVAPDVMNIKVGNIPANETVEIIFSVIQPLEIIINKFYELRLPVVLTERDSPSQIDRENTPNIQTVDTNRSLYREWNIQVEVKSNSPFIILSNPTHNLKPELSEKPSGTVSKIYKAVWNTTIIPNKDFVVYFGPEKLEKPETILATYPQEPNNHVLLVNFIPELTTIQPSVVRDLLLKTNSDAVLILKRMAYEYDIEHVQAEFIFLIDRSRSMEGARIENLKRALIKFLNTIPKASYFNIISFGSSAQRYKPQSILNSPQALEEALEWIKTIEADMKGTEILEALKALLNGARPNTHLPRIVMILTDGDVLNPDEVINQIYVNANKMRFCSVGIGSGASDYLVRNMAKAGKCTSEFVQDNEDIGDKALYMVQSAISQSITDVRFDISCLNDQDQKVYTEKAELDLLMKDQAFKKWIYLEDIPNLKSCQATLSYYNSLKDKTVTEDIDIQAYEIEEITNFWHKIAYDAKIKELEQGIKMGIFSYEDKNPQSQIVQLSTKYQILSDYTSFLAVLQEGTVNPNKKAQKIYVPSMKSADYFVGQRKFQQNSGGNSGYNRKAPSYNYNVNNYRNNPQNSGGNSGYNRKAPSYNYNVNNDRNNPQNSGVDIELDVMSNIEVTVDVELEYVGDDCAEVDFDLGFYLFPENEEEGGEINDEIIHEDSEMDCKTQNLNTIPAGFSCENVDNASTKECSQVEKQEEPQEKEEPKEEVSSQKSIESSDLKLVNNTIHANLTEMTNQTAQSGKVYAPSSSLISDEKESEGLHKSEEKSSKILGFGLIGISLLVILLSVILI